MCSYLHTQTTIISCRPIENAQTLEDEAKEPFRLIGGSDFKRVLLEVLDQTCLIFRRSFWPFLPMELLQLIHIRRMSGVKLFLRVIPQHLYGVDFWTLVTPKDLDLGNSLHIFLQNYLVNLGIHFPLDDETCFMPCGSKPSSCSLH